MRITSSSDSSATAVSSQPFDDLATSVIRSLENERRLDLHYRARRTDFDDDALPNYKVMKQFAIRARVGVLYRPFIALAQWTMPLVALGQWSLALLVATCMPRPRDSRTVHLIATTPNNVTLVESALLRDGSEPDQIDPGLMRLPRLAAEVGVAGVMAGAAAHARLLGRILLRPAHERRDLLLHSRDAAMLLLLTRYARTRPGHTFATDDHYQRWAYLLSHNCDNLVVAQHGFLDEAIAFEHSGGRIRKLFLRDESFLPYFARYYVIHDHAVFTPVRSLDEGPMSARAVFLASSFPSVDQEIELARWIRQRSDVPILVKFHPSHHYDGRRQTLATLADRVCEAAEYPACRAFVSHSSFMEYDYRALGVATFSIARCTSPEATAESILKELGR